MHWRDLLAKIGACDPPLPALVRASADRRGTIDRRAFLQLAGASVAALAIDPEQLLWTPGERALITAPTMREALALGLVAVFPNGDRVDLRVADADLLAREIRDIEAMGGQVIERRLDPFAGARLGGPAVLRTSGAILKRPTT